VRRREFISLLGGAAVAWPLAARAQQPERVRRIGVLLPFATDDPLGQRNLTALSQELRRLQWPDSALQMDVRWFGGNIERARAYAGEIVRLKPDVILVQSTPGLGALMRETPHIPIVFTVISDPVRQGIVSNVARPDGNVTGFSNVDASIASKWLELLKETVPHAVRAVVVHSPDDDSWRSYWEEIQAAARSLAITPIPTPVRGSAEIDRAIGAFSRQADVGLIVVSNPVTTANHKLLVTLAARHGLPAIYPYRYFVEGGGLLSYGIDISDLFRRAASYADRLLKGAKVADLPVQAPTEYQLVINLKTAKALGITITPTLLARAVEVIE
jgi:putative ABC transport system substrate-binding protein